MSSSPLVEQPVRYGRVVAAKSHQMFRPQGAGAGYPPCSAESERRRQVSAYSRREATPRDPRRVAPTCRLAGRGGEPGTGTRSRPFPTHIAPSHRQRGLAAGDPRALRHHGSAAPMGRPRLGRAAGRRGAGTARTPGFGIPVRAGAPASGSKSTSWCRPAAWCEQPDRGSFTVRPWAPARHGRSVHRPALRLRTPYSTCLRSAPRVMWSV